MITKWLQTKTDEEVDLFSKNFMDNHSTSLTNKAFWADEIKALKNDPFKRLDIALNNLPLPAAFREAVLALRSIIRNQKKEDDANLEINLTQLYWLAAINSLSVKYSSRCSCPGYNIMESIPGKIIKSIKINYKSLGYKKLDLLIKTDVFLIQKLWGEPNSHHTLNELESDLWESYELKYAQKIKQ